MFLESDNSSLNLNGNQIILNEIDTNTIEKLRHDLLRQAEVSNKLETLCLQYRQVRHFFCFFLCYEEFLNEFFFFFFKWVEKLTNDVNDWKTKYIRCESEKKLLVNIRILFKFFFYSFYLLIYLK